MSRDEELYDLYLDACLEGRAVPPDAFCAEHPDGGPALRRRIEALHRILDEPRAATPQPAAAEPGFPFERRGEFRLIRPLDRGGMGVLYLAEQEALGRAQGYPGNPAGAFPGAEPRGGSGGGPARIAGHGGMPRHEGHRR